MVKKLNPIIKIEDQLFSGGLTKNSRALIVLSNTSLAELVFELLREERKITPVYLLPHTETLPYDFFSPSSVIKNKRMQTLSRLLSSEKFLLISSVQALMNPCPAKSHLLPVESLKTKQYLKRKDFLKSIGDSGYERKEIVNEVGEYSVRGVVIDIFPTGSTNPIRIEVYEDTIESLRLFNPLTQITTKKIDTFSALPPQEYCLSNIGINNFKKNWRASFDAYEEDSEIFKTLSQGKAEEGAEIYLPLFFGKKTTVLDYLDDFDQIFLDQNTLEELDKYQELIFERFEEYRFDIKRPLINPQDLFLTKKEFNIFTKKRKVKQIRVDKYKKDKAIPLKEDPDTTYREVITTMPEVDDLVVHLFHGIGIYRGLKNIISKNVIHDCLEIEYRDESKVYVPVDSMHLVSKYFGPEDISLDTLGSKKWEKKKTVAIQRTYDTAVELLNIQATRNSKKGTKYLIPAEEYSEFCQEFPYIETVDQSLTISEIETDLQQTRPMDRLVCGEVGFGKTEVAMRASFITAFNNYQTCILVPTTLLAQQHYDNFIKRFSKTPINIEKLSREVSPHKKREILSKLKEGKIDIIIGTHALLQKSVSFNNLGLLVIDEEHRFGVRQKEKIKKFKQEVNLLYLSATPIPRSLNLSLSKLKDLSIIATAPSDRISVRTFVYRFNENLLKECIQRELLRSGQIYYLCNDLRLIEDRKQRIEEFFPDIKVDIVHGQLKGQEIEERMVLFQNGEIDVLVCSTIIESGLDISNANTLIVEAADRLGLAQLHQLRGRVGRGNKQAFAYFLKSTGILKRKKAESRLKALQDSDSLSAGFLLSMRDLEIRGAGEILGENQSGIMESIGIDLYMRLLNKATDQIKKGELNTLRLERQVEVNLNTSSNIPETYLPDINQRLIMYNKISSALSLEDLKDIQLEMINRFGLFPPELKILFFETEISLSAIPQNIKEIKVTNDEIKICYLDSSKDKRLKKGVDFEDNIKKIYKEINFIAKAS